MRAPATFLVLTAILAAIWINEARAEKKTVCSITVNSADESEAFRRHLPPDKFQFVELVERGRADWLESACRQGIRCDVLVISGHYDGGNEFFSDRLDAREFLPVDEMERVSCSNSCPGLFSQLKEVYLFGCNTLNAEPPTFASAEIGRSLVRSGHSQADADRLSRELSTRHGDSSRDRMRQIFMNVPVIYGFSSVAPLGPTAASILSRHFQAAGTGDVGSGRASPRMLGAFAGHSMAVASGLNDQAPQAAYRREVCQFSDDRLSPAQKAGLRASAAEPRHGGSPLVPGPHRTICRLAQRDRTAGSRGRRRARCNRARSGGACAISGLCARRRPAGGPRPDDRTGGRPGLALSRGAAGGIHPDDRRSIGARIREHGRRRPGMYAQQGSHARRRA